MTDEDKKQAEEKKETKKGIIKDIKKSGVSKEMAREEEKLNEKAVKQSDKEAEKQEEKKSEKKPEIKIGKTKKTEAIVNAKDIPISTKHSAAICRFIRKKRISQAIYDLQKVAKMKKPVPMRGEIPHRHGDIMSGRFPQKAAKEFIILLKSLDANANYAGIENPIISEAKANIGARPFGRRGIRKKRTHITLIAKAAGEKNEK